MLGLILNMLWYILPAYVANASAVLAKGRTPLDQNVKFIDGRRLLGKGKTVKGFAFAVLMGTAVGVILGYVEGDIYARTLLAFVLSFGAMAGDSAGSFIKRRFDIKSGQAAPLLDQWDFVLSALFFHWAFLPWIPLSLPSGTGILAILVITALLHVGANAIAYRLKLKKVPW